MIDKILTRNGAMFIAASITLAVFIVAMYNTKPDKVSNRIRIEQKVDYSEDLDNQNYFLITEIYIDNEYHSRFYDFGTIKEIDSLKCIRYKESTKIANNLIYLNEKKCN